MTHEGWPAVLGVLAERRDLTPAQAGGAMAAMLAGEATPAQIAGFLLALRVKGETVDELTAMLDAMTAAGEHVVLADVDEVIDTCGTGGDRSHSINVSTIAAFVVAGAGGKVCKHGNRAASSSCGSADLLEALGVGIEQGPDRVAASIEHAGIGFCFAPRYHPAMRHVGPTRRELGVRTAFNLLGPLANPAGVRRQVVGVAEPALGALMAEVLVARGAARAMIVHGNDGLDELTTTTTSTVWDVQGSHLVVRTVDPVALGIAAADPAALRGGDPAENARHARAVLDGTPGAHRDIVVLNAAAALVVAGLAEDLDDGLVAAAAAIDSGAAARALDRLVEATT